MSLHTDIHDIVVVVPDGDDDLTGLDVDPMKKLYENDWWSVYVANFRDTQQDFPTEGGHSMSIWNNGGASTYCTVYCQMETSSPNGSTYVTDTFEPSTGIFSFGESPNSVVEEQLNWSELCDVGTSVRRAEMMPRFAII